MAASHTRTKYGNEGRTREKKPAEHSRSLGVSNLNELLREPWLDQQSAPRKATTVEISRRLQLAHNSELS
jgi:hypothetical protein